MWVLTHMHTEREDVLKFASVLKVEGEEAKAVILF
jgi:hypothetical protein